MTETAHDRRASSRPGALPRLAVLFEPTSVGVFDLVEAASGTWETVWLIDHDISEIGNMPKVLARFGTVLEVAGLSPSQVKEALRARPVDGIVVFEDTLLLRAAEIAEELGLLFYSTETAALMTDKYAQRRALRAAGVPTPGNVLVPAGTSADKCRELTAALTFPLVVKPVAGNGSRDVVAVDDVERLVALFADPASRVSAQDMIVEERIPGRWATGERPYADYVSVETFVSNGRASHFGVTGRMPLAEPFREAGLFVPDNLSPEDWDAVTRAAEQGIAALGAQIGAFHTEVKLTPDGCRVVEVNGRLGGYVSKAWSLVTGRSLHNLAGRVALGEEVDAGGSDCSGVAFDYFFQPPMGVHTLLAVEGLDAVRRMPGILEAEMNRRTGEFVGDWIRGTRSFIYKIHGKAATHEAMWAMLDEVFDTVRITYGVPEQ